ncbi:hypothetical protein ACQEVC_34335 [Plantactinospora sp. CA-294935]|uniref:hypothetical protein n=1 Tax=Plantactinospora sp. CA-294935 TaxID=3240012 RepID=UPI003D9184BF
MTTRSLLVLHVIRYPRPVPLGAPMDDSGNIPRPLTPAVGLALAGAGVDPGPRQVLATQPLAEQHVPGIGAHTWYSNAQRVGYAELLHVVHRPDLSDMRFVRRWPFIVSNDGPRHCQWCAEAWPCTYIRWAGTVVELRNVRRSL